MATSLGFLGPLSGHAVASGEHDQRRLFFSASRAGPKLRAWSWYSVFFDIHRWTIGGCWVFGKVWTSKKAPRGSTSLESRDCESHLASRRSCPVAAVLFFRDVEHVALGHDQGHKWNKAWLTHNRAYHPWIRLNIRAEVQTTIQRMGS